MASYEALCVQAPKMDHGTPILPDTGLAWNIAVEVAMPSDPDSLLGSFVLGTSTLASKAWYDVTERVRGWQIERGGSPGDRPEPGTIMIELDNNDNSLSTWTSNDYFLNTENQFLGPGTLVRIAAHNGPDNPSPFELEDFTLDAEVTANIDGTYTIPISTVAANDRISVTGPAFDMTGKELVLQTDTFPPVSGMNCSIHIGLQDATNSNYISAGADLDTGGTAIVSMNYSSGGTDWFEAEPSDFYSVIPNPNANKFWRLKEDSGTLTYSVSVDGSNWTDVYYAPAPTWITNCKALAFTYADVIGLPVNNWTIASLSTGGFAEEWIPLGTGIVEQWDETTQALGGSSTITITAVETLSVLAQVDENATSLVGAGDSPNTRIQRLLDAAEWQFGANLEYGGPTRTFQSTDMSQNRLAELYLTADSVDELLKSGRDGRVWFGQRDSRSVDPDDVFFSAGAPRIVVSSTYTDWLFEDLWVPASIDDLVTVNNDDLLLSKVVLARVGGSAVTTENTYMSGRYQRRVFNRSDLITQNPGSDADLTYVADRILERADETFRPDSIRIDGKLHYKCIFFLLTMDIGHLVRIDTDDVIFGDFGICSYTLTGTPMADGWDLVGDLRFEPTTVSYWLRT